MYTLANVTYPVLNFGIGFVLPTVAATKLQPSDRYSVVPPVLAGVALAGLSFANSIPLSMQYGFGVSASCLTAQLSGETFLGRMDDNSKILNRKEIDACMVKGTLCGAIVWIATKIFFPTPVATCASILASNLATRALIHRSGINEND